MNDHKAFAGEALYTYVCTDRKCKERDKEQRLTASPASYRFATGNHIRCPHCGSSSFYSRGEAPRVDTSKGTPVVVVYVATAALRGGGTPHVLGVFASMEEVKQAVARPGFDRTALGWVLVEKHSVNRPDRHANEDGIYLWEDE